MKYTCPICGHKTLDARCDWDVCPICFWEDDVLENKGDRTSSANQGLRISEAQANYMVFESCSKDHERSVRSPLPHEELDPNWQPLPEAIVLAESIRSKLDSGTK
ncbi:CPCC family cysteine-rich protein [Planctomicrobium sp. SH661]|uniref:CPCC family cysteine-rich protein n=1 Tax=Planctomicrobium sp. SH661 TaxID=3448124 RepID=UPI003F5C5091